MFKYAVTSLCLLLATAAPAQFATPEWSAHYSDWSCYVMRSVGPIVVGTVDGVEVIVGFYASRIAEEGHKPDQPESATPVKLRVQVLPPFPSWHLFKEPRVAVSVMSGQSAIPLILDSSSGLYAKPFILDDDAATQVWNELRNGDGMELVIRLAEDHVVTVPVASEHVTIAAAMMDACLDESRRHREEE